MEKFDAFGFDAQRVDKTLQFFEYYYRYWYSVTCDGLGNVPKEGPVIFYGNHAGFNMLDILMLQVAVRRFSPAKRFLRAMFHIGSEKTPGFGDFITNSLGGVLGHPHNARYLLEKGEALLTYPEGGHSTGRPHVHRRRMAPIEKFGGGFLKLAAETSAHIIPVATVGCEEAMPTLAFSRGLGKHFKFDNDLYPIVPQSFITLIPSFFGIPLHSFHFLFGLPSNIKILIGEPSRVHVNDDLNAMKISLYNKLENMISLLDD